MFALFGLFILIIKIGIYAVFYSTLGLLIIYLFSKKTKQKWVLKLADNKFLTWFLSNIILSVSFFFYSFSYWNYSGLGDYFCIPIGNEYVVSAIDACDNSFIQTEKDNNARQTYINKFAIVDHKVCGEFLGYNTTTNVDTYIVFDSKTESIKEFNSKADYSVFAQKNKLPSIDEFQDFWTNYNNYWSANKNWFVP